MCIYTGIPRHVFLLHPSWTCCIMSGMIEHYKVEPFKISWYDDIEQTFDRVLGFKMFVNIFNSNRFSIIFEHKMWHDMVQHFTSHLCQGWCGRLPFPLLSWRPVECTPRKSPLYPKPSSTWRTVNADQIYFFCASERQKCGYHSMS